MDEQAKRRFLDLLAALQSVVVDDVAPILTEDPKAAEIIADQVSKLEETTLEADDGKPPPPDKGLARLIGLGPEATDDIGTTRLPDSIEVYDETVSSERILAIADLYYIYQHETIGVFRVIQKLQELFRAGALYLSNGKGAMGLYQFDRKEVLRYTRTDRLVAYRRAFGYGTAPVLPASRPNTDFHPLFTHFNNEVALFWRDKRISDVIRERAYDPSFGSIAVVRRAGLDLRNNLKLMSYGHLNVLRVEVMQLLDEAFRILESDDIKKLVGADTAWDVIEIILTQHFNERLVTSPRQRMAVTGREVLRWLAQPHIMQPHRPQFEALLLDIAEMAEEWLTSAQSLGLAQRSPAPGVLPWSQRSQRPASPPASPAMRPRAAPGRTPASNGARVPR